MPHECNWHFPELEYKADMLMFRKRAFSEPKTESYGSAREQISFESIRDFRGGGLLSGDWHSMPRRHCGIFVVQRWFGSGSVSWD